MSNKTQGNVWDLDLPHSEKWVLLAMADHSDHEGRNIYTGHDLIAYKCNLAEDTVIRIVRRLCDRGILQLDFPDHRPSPNNTYHIEWQNCTFKPKFVRDKRKSVRRTDDSSVNHSPKQRTDDSSVNSGKRTDSQHPINRLSTLNEPTLETKEPTPEVPATHELTHLTVNPLINHIEPRASAPISLPKKITFDPDKLAPCRQPGCNVMCDPTLFNGYCHDHRPSGGRAPTPRTQSQRRPQE